MLPRSTPAFAMLLGLAACTGQTMADGSTRMSISPANLFAQPANGYGQPGAGPPAVTGGEVPPDGALVRRVAARFAADWRGGGMVGLVTDIKGCYAAAERGEPNRAALRDCIALDTAAKNRDRLNERRFRVPGMDYLSDDAALARFNRYAPQVFASQAESLDFIGVNGRAVYLQGAAMLGPG